MFNFNINLYWSGFYWQPIKPKLIPWIMVKVHRMNLSMIIVQTKQRTNDKRIELFFKQYAIKLCNNSKKLLNQCAFYLIWLDPCNCTIHVYIQSFFLFRKFFSMWFKCEVNIIQALKMPDQSEISMIWTLFIHNEKKQYTPGALLVLFSLRHVVLFLCPFLFYFFSQDHVRLMSTVRIGIKTKMPISTVIEDEMMKERKEMKK